MEKIELDNLPKVSVIIPVYNTEKYLRQCLDSVINQTLKDIEVICIDDGSTDSSLEILEEYAQKDNRFTIISQKNLGAGVARNKGLNIAKSEFLYFLDSDDYVKEIALEMLYKKAKETDSDICLCKHVEFNTKTQVFSDCPWSLQENLLPEKDYFSLTDIPERLLDICPPNLFIKLFRREFIKEQDICFQEIKTCNDVFFSFTAMLLARKISVVKEIFCVYRTEHENLTKLRGKHAECIEKAYKKIKETVKQRGLLDVCEQTLYKATISNFTYEYWFCKQRKRFELLSLAKKFLPKSYFKDLLKNIFVKRYQRYFCGAIEIIKSEQIVIIKLFNVLILSVKNRNILQKFLQNIFSVRNSENKKHKIITIFGIKIKKKRKDR